MALAAVIGGGLVLATTAAKTVIPSPFHNKGILFF